MKLLAVDPVGCGCTECLVGEYVPLPDATKENILAVARGELGDNTSQIAHVEYEWSGVTITLGPHTFVYEDESYDTLPPKDLAFEHLRITFDEDNFNRIRDWL